MYVIGVSAAAVALEAAHQAGSLLPFVVPCLHISGQLFGLTSFALSLLLVFRTNASYERWDGARKTWGMVLNRSRDLVRQGLTYASPDRPELRDMLCRWVPAFSRALMCHVRKGEDLAAELKGVLKPHEVEQVLLSQHRPNYVLQVLSEIIKGCGAPTAAHLKMEENVTSFEDALGGCERVLRTPIPLSYTRHTSRFLMIWLTLLPFTLLASCGVATVPVCALVAFLLLGVEEIGVSIEEPFSILPLEAICGTALTNIRELQTTHGASGPRAPGNDAARPLAASQLVRCEAAAGAGAGAGARVGAGLPGASGAGGRALRGAAGAGVGAGMQRVVKEWPAFVVN